MACPTPVINIPDLEADRETSEGIETDGENTFAVKGKCLTLETP